jgi:transcriptional regulator with XRE-family HTH domain
MVAMATRDSRRARGRRTATATIRRIGAELRDARCGAGLSRRAVAAAVGISHTHLGRIERGDVTGVSLVMLVQIAAVVGLDLPARTFPGPDPLRDAGQIALIERLRGRLGPGLRLRIEVPLPSPSLRAWDGVIDSRRGSRPVEAETGVTDLQDLDRRLHLKMRDGNLDGVILLVADTRRNRAALRSAPPSWRESFPVGGGRALRDLAEGKLPAGSALIVL